MMRLWGYVTAVGLALSMAGPAWSLTQEEVLQRRLEKMHQAEPQLREAVRNREEEQNPPGDVGTALPTKDDADNPTIPAPVRGPAPEPKGSLWDKPQPSATPAGKPVSPAASVSAPLSPTVSPVAAPPVSPSPPVPAKRKEAAKLAAKAVNAAKKGDYKTALAKLNAAVAADPTDPDLHNNRGDALLNLGKPAEALADYNQAIAMKSSDPVFFTNRGLAHERLGNLERACADYQSACNLGDCEFFKSFKDEGHCR